MATEGYPITQSNQHETPAWRKPAAVSFAASLTIHAAAILGALLIVWTVTLPKREVPPEITVSFFDPAPSGVVLTESSPQPGPSSQPPTTIRPEVFANASQPTLSEKIAASNPSAAAGTTPEARAARSDLITSRTYADVRFGGLSSGNAEKIVYVVDASGSMVTTLDRVKDDLKRSISKLTRAQMFEVIFFRAGDWTTPRHPGDVGSIKTARLTRATPERLAGVLAWIDTIEPGGRGDPIKGLSAALALKPDAVFVLSSVIPGAGQWKPDRAEVLAELEKLNPVIDEPTGRRAAVIKTIQYLDADPQGILESIAKAHGGKDGYKFIPREPAPRENPTR